MSQPTANRKGFTLLEVIVALTMFGVIMAATTFAVSAVLQASTRSQQRLEASTDVRGVMSFLTHDIQSAFASNSNPASVFIANGGESGGDLGNMGVLTLSTSLHRIDAPGLGEMGQGNSQPQPSKNQAMTPAQSDVEMVRYDFDPQTKIVARQHINVPNLMLLAQKTTLPETIIARNVLDFRLRFWDANNRTWRPNWDYQQKNQAQDDNSSGQNGQGGQNSPSQNNTSNKTDATGDTTLPNAVEVTITIQQADGSPATFTTIVPLYSNQPLTAPTPPKSTGNNGANNGSSSPNGSGNPNGNGNSGSTP